MTIELRPPRPGEEPRLQELFTEAFGDEGFTSLFFSTGYSPQRCCVAAEGDILAALHWFDCTLEGRRAAYIYGIAVFHAHRGRGIGSALIRGALAQLQEAGYASLLLVPAESALFPYYARFGFRAVSTIAEKEISAAAPLPIRKLTAGEYAGLRRKLLSAHSVIQEGPCLDLLGGYAGFYATPNALAAVTDAMVWELLGDEADAPGLLAALGLESAAVRTPGEGRPFAMGLGVDGPVYLGLALD